MVPQGRFYLQKNDPKNLGNWSSIQYFLGLQEHYKNRMKKTLNFQQETMQVHFLEVTEIWSKKGREIGV